MFSSGLLAAMVAIHVTGQAMSPQQYLEQLERVLPRSVEWEQWLEASGELPPDFTTLTTIPNPRSPLAPVVDGHVEIISSTGDWEKRREELKALFQRWVLGTVPPRPDNLEAKIVRETDEEGAHIRDIELRFGPGRKARLRAEILIPPGKGPFPVFMTQHNHRAWALIALRRGYLACVYSGSDSQDDTDTFVEAYPEHDWSRLMRRAWAASRCIDYLETEPIADCSKIALTGHSRNGKQSLMASAFDERIAVVISSSSGAGGSLATRNFSDPHFGEGIESITRRFPDWFHPRLRFFVGRENKLPVDLHELVALSAPRPCLISSARNDDCESAWAAEQTYHLVKPVYALYGADENLRILWRPMAHETWTTTIERYVDWCDAQFGRGEYAFTEEVMYPHAFDRLDVESSAKPETLAPFDIPGAKEAIRQSVETFLGARPPHAYNPGGTYGEEPAHVEQLLARDSSPGTITKRDLVFGEYINADVYLPSDIAKGERPIPAILWLHPISAPNGYMAAYKRGPQPVHAMAQSGFAVFAYDQIGFGRRIDEAQHFYARHPEWSLLGKMVHDAQAALDVMVTLPYVDPSSITVVGYGIGGLVGSHVCALDERPARLVTVCGPQPFRRDFADTTGGLERWSQRFRLLPGLELYIGREREVPYDLHSLWACHAPKPLLLIAPELDWRARPEDVEAALDAARKACERAGGEPDALVLETPEDYNHFGPEMQQRVLEWLKQ
jgi:dienelactone hydrolase